MIKPSAIECVEDAFKIKNASGENIDAKGMKLIVQMMVDKTGLDDCGPAMSVSRYQTIIEGLLDRGKIFGVIAEEGLFQVVVNIYERGN